MSTNNLTKLKIVPNFIWVWICQHIVDGSIDGDQEGVNSVRLIEGKKEQHLWTLLFILQILQIVSLFLAKRTREKKNNFLLATLSVLTQVLLLAFRLLFLSITYHCVWVSTIVCVFFWKPLPSLFYVVSLLLSCVMRKWLFRTAGGREMGTCEKKIVIFTRRSLTACIRTTEFCPFCHSQHPKKNCLFRTNIFDVMFTNVPCTVA